MSCGHPCVLWREVVPVSGYPLLGVDSTCLKVTTLLGIVLLCHRRARGSKHTHMARTRVPKREAIKGIIGFPKKMVNRAVHWAEHVHGEASPVLRCYHKTAVSTVPLWFRRHLVRVCRQYGLQYPYSFASNERAPGRRTVELTGLPVLGLSWWTREPKAA